MVDEAPPGMAASDEKMAFADSLGVLDYVRTSAPWKGTKEIEEVLNQYYNCLDYGGRIYMTKSMPAHFSPAWLLVSFSEASRACPYHMLLFFSTSSPSFVLVSAT
jgi:hypothetical protein